jgi:Zn finger protein HypA/HybF involved in hydrogenase expression
MTYAAEAPTAAMHCVQCDHVADPETSPGRCPECGSQAWRLDGWDGDAADLPLARDSAYLPGVPFH